mmetsp:Transcript_12796/g.40423  ORF Transcript_12796/g.40423 Transcript_12796/m.40423 type:complete len:289 (+) Transcript_12796:380-1246(+)
MNEMVAAPAAARESASANDTASRLPSGRVAKARASFSRLSGVSSGARFGERRTSKGPPGRGSSTATLSKSRSSHTCVDRGPPFHARGCTAGRSCMVCVSTCTSRSCSFATSMSRNGEFFSGSGESRVRDDRRLVNRRRSSRLVLAPADEGRSPLPGGVSSPPGPVAAAAASASASASRAARSRMSASLDIHDESTGVRSSRTTSWGVAKSWAALSARSLASSDAVAAAALRRKARPCLRTIVSRWAARRRGRAACSARIDCPASQARTLPPARSTSRVTSGIFTRVTD